MPNFAGPSAFAGCIGRARAGYRIGSAVRRYMGWRPFGEAGLRRARLGKDKGGAGHDKGRSEDSQDARNNLHVIPLSV
jgi:hypothetical protein